MGLHDDELNDFFDNFYNKNFYKTKERRGYGSENEDVNKKVDSIIDEIDKKAREKPFIEKIQFLMEIVHNNIKYDYNLKDFVDNKKLDPFAKNYYDYKNSAKEVIKNKTGTCVGFSNTFKTLCQGSGIECKILVFHNNKLKIHHQLNTVFDNGKKYYADPTWGFIVDDLETLKKILREEIPNPRTNQYIDNWEASEYSNTDTETEYEVDQIVDNSPAQKKNFEFVKILITILIIAVIFGIANKVMR